MKTKDRHIATIGRATSPTGNVFEIAASDFGLLLMN